MSQKIHFVTGKGGVGKSLYAAALATHLGKTTGGRGLLVELGDQSFYRSFLEFSNIGFKPQALSPQLDVAIWSGQESLREYALHLLKVETLVNLFFENKVMKTFVGVAPALTEIAMLGKITSGIRRHGPPLNYDFIVVDAFSTGHFKALLEAPKGLSEVIQMGPMGEQSRSILEVLKNPEHTNYHVLSLPESLPAKEATELDQYLRQNWKAETYLIMNKFLPEWSSQNFKGEFAQSFRNKIQNQHESLKYLKRPYKTLPFVPEIEAKKLVQILSQEFTWL